MGGDGFRMGVEPSGQLANLLVEARQDGDAALGHAAVEQLTYLYGHLGGHLVGVGLDYPHASSFLAGQALLPDVGVGVDKICIAQAPHEVREESAVEIDYLPAAAAVYRERLRLRLSRLHVHIDLPRHDVGIAVAPAVDGLLDVAHDEALMAACRVLLQQRAEVIPLQAARVLELVDEYVVYLCARLLVDECRVAWSRGHAHEHEARVSQHEAAVAPAVLPYLRFDAADELQLVEVLADERNGILFLDDADECGEHRAERPILGIDGIAQGRPGVAPCLLAHGVLPSRERYLRRQPLARLLEQAVGTVSLPVEVVLLGAEAVAQGEEALGHRLFVAACLPLPRVQSAAQADERVRMLAQQRVKLLRVPEVCLAVEVLPERRQLPLDVPSLFVFDVSLDVADDGAHGRRVEPLPGDEVVDALADDTLRVELDVEVMPQLQLLGQPAEDADHERVDGLDTESRVVVEY